MKRTYILLLAAGLLCSCATAYQQLGTTGGYVTKHLEEKIYRITFSGNGHTTRESIQTYWLYRCAEFTLEQGYKGFQVLSNLHFVRGRGIGIPRLLPVQIVIVPLPGGGANPVFEGDIRLLQTPFEPTPPKVFDAAALKEALEPYVKGAKCSKNNVCPHAHKYLYPIESKPGGQST